MKQDLDFIALHKLYTLPQTTVKGIAVWHHMKKYFPVRVDIESHLYGEKSNMEYMSVFHNSHYIRNWGVDNNKIFARTFTADDIKIDMKKEALILFDRSYTYPAYLYIPLENCLAMHPMSKSLLGEDTEENSDFICIEYRHPSKAFSYTCDILIEIRKEALAQIINQCKEKDFIKLYAIEAIM